MNKPIRVMVVENIEDIREGIRQVLEADPDLKVIGVFDCAEDALKKFRADLYDVALVDIGLPGMSGIDLISRMKAIDPGLEAMVWTIYDQGKLIFPSIRAGASGYLLKTASPQQIIGGIKEVVGGGGVMSGRIARQVIDFLRPSRDSELESAGITKRELEILEHLAQGSQYKDIASELSISMHTVRSHVHNIYDKLHVKNRAQAVRKVRKSLSP